MNVQAGLNPQRDIVLCITDCEVTLDLDVDYLEIKLSQQEAVLLAGELCNSVFTQMRRESA